MTYNPNRFERIVANVLYWLGVSAVWVASIAVILLGALLFGILVYQDPWLPLKVIAGVLCGIGALALFAFTAAWVLEVREAAKVEGRR